MRDHAYDEVVLDSNQGASVTPRTFQGLAIKMKNHAQMDESTLEQIYGEDWHEEIQDEYLRTIL